MKNDTQLEFTDISSEKYRTYEWGDGRTITIKQPKLLNVSESGGHRILDNNNISHYVPSGWIHLYWEVHDGKPNFVK